MALNDIADQIGDNNSTVVRMYRGLMIVEQAEKAKVFSRSDITKNKFSFNYIYTGMDYPGIIGYLGLRTKGVTPENPVPQSKVKNLENLMLWLYGRDSSDTPSLIRSQNPDLKTLDTVLLTDAGVKALKDGLPLSVAHDISQGDERLFRQALQQAKQALQKALGTLTTGFSSDDTDMPKLAADIQSLANDLVEAITTKKRETNVKLKKQRATNLLSVPSPNSDDSLVALADWAEVKALLAEDGNASQEDLTRALEQAHSMDESDAKALAGDVFKELLDRRDTCVPLPGKGREWEYPFTINSRGTLLALRITNSVQGPRPGCSTSSFCLQAGRTWMRKEISRV